MIKKFPARLVGHRPKSIILKSESSPQHGLRYTDYQADEAAKVRFNEKFDPDTNTYESIKIESVKAQAAEDIASRTGTKKWGNLVVKKLKRENIFKKSISTAKDKPRFVKKWEKLLKSSNIEAEATRVNTALLFTGRKGLDPLKYQPGTEAKYIKSKRFKKGLPTGVSGKDIGWAPQEPSSLAQKKYYAITQSKQENIFKSGRGYFDVKSQSFKYRPKKKK
jgi:hypothetical protein